MSAFSVFSAATLVGSDSFDFGDIGSGFNANRLFFACVLAGNGLSDPEVPTSISADGLTWVELGRTTNPGGDKIGMSVWRGTGTPGAGGDVTVSYATAQDLGTSISLAESTSTLSSISESGDASLTPLVLAAPSGTFSETLVWTGSSATTLATDPALTELHRTGNSKLSCGWIVGGQATYTSTFSSGFAHGYALGLVPAFPATSLTGTTATQISLEGTYG